MRILKELKLDNDTMSKVRTLVQWWKEPVGTTDAQIRRTMSQMSDELFDSLMLLKNSVVETEIEEGRYDLSDEESGMASMETLRTRIVPETLKELDTIMRQAEDIRSRGDCISLKMLAVTGSDLIQAGMKPGKQLGEALNRLFELVLEHPEMNEKDRLLQEI